MNKRRIIPLFFIIGVGICSMFVYVIYYKIQNPSIVKTITSSESMSKEDMQDIIAKYMSKIKKDPNDIEALKTLGSIFIQMKAWSNAKFFLQRAYNISNTDKDIILNLAMCYLFLKQYKEASSLLKKLIILDPENYMAKFNLAYLYGFILKDKQKSRDLFKELANNENIPKNIREEAKNYLNEIQKNGGK